MTYFARQTTLTSVVAWRLVAKGSQIATTPADWAIVVVR